MVFALTRQYTCDYGEKIANIVLNMYVNQNNQPTLLAAEAARENGNSPNTVVSSAVAIVGKKMVQKAMDASNALLDLFQFTKLGGPKENFDYAAQLKEAEKYKDTLLSDEEDPCAAKLVDYLNKAGDSVFIKFVQDFAAANGGKLSTDALFGAVWVTLGWEALKGKKISKETLVRLPWYSRCLLYTSDAADE